MVLRAPSIRKTTEPLLRSAPEWEPMNLERSINNNNNRKGKRSPFSTAQLTEQETGKLLVFTKVNLNE